MTRPAFPILSIAGAVALSILEDATIFAVLPSSYVHVGHKFPDVPIFSDIELKGLQSAVDFALRGTISLIY